MANIKILIIMIFFAVALAGTLIFASAKKNNTDTNTIATNQSINSDVLRESIQEQVSTEKKIYEKISSSKAKDLITKQTENLNFHIIDIRTKEEFDSGNIERSINFDFYGDFEKELLSLDKNHTYLIYCRSGNRSSQAMEMFKKLEFSEVYDLEGGYSAWAVR